MAPRQWRRVVVVVVRRGDGVFCIMAHVDACQIGYACCFGKVAHASFRIGWCDYWQDTGNRRQFKNLIVLVGVTVHRSLVAPTARCLSAASRCGQKLLCCA